MTTWTPTRRAGLAQLAAFAPYAGADYARLRNYDNGQGKHNHVSTLSPWIRHRLITEEEVVGTVLAHHTHTAADKFIQEVFWRTYWKGWLERRPTVWADYQRQTRTLIDRLDSDSGLRDRFEAAVAGRTGIDGFDGWCKELLDTGYLHNHARMWFASIWIFTLTLPWELGADFFLRHLIDGDPASNTLSWRWVAGLQTRGKTYLARPSNIAKYTSGRLNPCRQLSDQAIALDGPQPPDPIAPPQPQGWDRSKPTGLIITEEDLQPVDWFDQPQTLTGIAVLKATRQRSALDLSPCVQDFVDGALTDAVARVQHDVDSTDNILWADHQIDPLVDWARGSGFEQVVTGYAPVGPTAAHIASLEQRLEEANIRLVKVLRRWDESAWQHTTRSFGNFRKHIPALVANVRNAG